MQKIKIIFLKISLETNMKLIKSTYNTMTSKKKSYKIYILKKYRKPFN
jgi:hypothetical protein